MGKWATYARRMTLREAPAVVPPSLLFQWTTLTTSIVTMHSSRRYLGSFFTLVAPASVSLCYFTVKRLGNPAGSLTFEIWSDNAGLPSVLIASSAPVAMMTYPTVKTLVSINIAPTPLPAAVKHWMIMHTTVGDGINALQMHGAAVAPQLPWISAYAPAVPGWAGYSTTVAFSHALWGVPS